MNNEKYLHKLSQKLNIEILINENLLIKDIRLIYQNKKWEIINLYDFFKKTFFYYDSKTFFLFKRFIRLLIIKLSNFNLNQNDNICYLIKLIRYDGILIKYLPEEYHTENICFNAIRENYLCLPYIKIKTDEMYYYILNEIDNHQINSNTKYDHIVKYLINPSKFIKLKIIKNNPLNSKYFILQ